MSLLTRSSLPWLITAGFVSAMVTIAASRTGLFVLLGLPFGAALTAYFAFYEGYSSPLTLSAFLAACVAAFPLSQLAAGGALFALGGGGQDLHTPISMLVCAGGSGALGPVSQWSRNAGLLVVEQ
jgi:hypothetical protein